MTEPTNVPRFPYSSPEARTRAEAALDAGRQSLHAHPAHRASAPTFPAVDELLFYVGQGREKQRLEIEAAHGFIPEEIVPRRRGETDERSIAQRVRQFLETVDRRVTELLDANSREVERRRAAERAQLDLIKSLLIIAPHHQGAHSDLGQMIAQALDVPFPIRLGALDERARRMGFDRYELWPWLLSPRASGDGQRP